MSFGSRVVLCGPRRPKAKCHKVWTCAHNQSMLFGLRTALFSSMNIATALNCCPNFGNTKGRLISFSSDCNIWGLCCADIFIGWLILPMQKKCFHSKLFQKNHSGCMTPSAQSWRKLLYTHPYIHLQLYAIPFQCTSWSGLDRQELAKKPVIIGVSACDCEHLCYATARTSKLV